MASNNRAALINKVLKTLKSRYKPAEINRDRSLLEHLLYACCLQNSLHNAADQVFDQLTKEYFDWNEVRVSSIRELTAVMKPLADPKASAVRLKRVLQSVFETHYTFDLESMKKQNIGQTVKQIGKYNGATPFTVAFVTQNALSGHSIPINPGLLVAMHAVGVISDSEAAKGTVPGLERVVPKTKGVEVGSILHQMGVEVHRSPFGTAVRKLLLEINPDCKERLPKRPGKKVATPTEKKSVVKNLTQVTTAAKPNVKADPPKKTSVKAAPAPKKNPTKVPPTSKRKSSPSQDTVAKKKAVKKKAVKKKAVKKKAVKKTPAKKAAAKKKTKAPAKGKKQSSNKKLTKRKRK